MFLFHITRRIYLVPHLKPWIDQGVVLKSVICTGPMAPIIGTAVLWHHFVALRKNFVAPVTAQRWHQWQIFCILWHHAYLANLGVVWDQVSALDVAVTSWPNTPFLCGRWIAHGSGYAVVWSRAVTSGRNGLGPMLKYRCFFRNVYQWYQWSLRQNCAHSLCYVLSSVPNVTNDLLPMLPMIYCQCYQWYQ